MKILVVATKSPWPPVDGGRLALRNTLYALARFGHEVTLVAPVGGDAADHHRAQTALAGSCRPELVNAQPLPAISSALRAEVSRRPYTIVRHTLPAVHDRVEAVLAGERHDIIHAEQIQAVAQCRGAFGSGLPMVLRQQNVESRLWTFAGAFRRPFAASLFKREARRLAQWEARVMNEVAATVALTADDAAHLRRLARRRAGVEHVPVPFTPELPAGERTLAGYPPVVFLASRGWRPNLEAARVFVGEWWPVVHRKVRNAQLHVFGVGSLENEARGVTWHGSPVDSAEAFPAGAVVVIPPRHATGVPMKGLEAWARGLPIVASPEAAKALEAEHGSELLVAADAMGFAKCVRGLADDPGLAKRLVHGGRAALRNRHRPESIAARLTEVYERVRAR